MTLKKKLKAVRWLDLTKMTLPEVIFENTMNLPWLLGSWYFAWFELYYLAIPCSAFFFLTTLRQVHSGFHHTLGLGKKLTRANLVINSILMISSVHAIKFNHLRHHKFNLQPQDYEGRAAGMTWWGAILYGPLHVYHIHRSVFELKAARYKKYVRFEMALIAVFVFVVFFYQVEFLIYHVMAMTFGELLSAFFAVYTVHHGCSEETVGRTQRSWFKNFITYSMYYHLEHHLFPAVPTSRLAELARRIDVAEPSLEKKIAF